jgi:Transposase DDE domain group 1/Ornithine cyclodeaminase/mu-crystallin family
VRRIRNAKDTGLRNLPLKGFAQNQLWCEIAALAGELLAWTQMLALTETARRWEPKRLRLRLFSAAGRLARGGRRLRLRLAARWPWASVRRHRPPAGPAVRLTSPNHPCDTKGATPGPVEPRPPGATAGQPDTARARKSASAEPFRPARQARETSRLSDADIAGQLVEYVAGDKPGRERDDERAYFNAVGLAFVDVAITLAMYRRAVDAGKGRQLTMQETTIFGHPRKVDYVRLGTAIDADAG